MPVVQLAQRVVFPRESVRAEKIVFHSRSPVGAATEDKLINLLAGICTDIDVGVSFLKSRPERKTGLAIESYIESLNSAISYIRTFPQNHIVYKDLHKEFCEMLTFIRESKIHVSREEAISFKKKVENLSGLTKKTIDKL